MSKDLKIEIEFTGDTGYLTSNTNLTDDQRRNLIKSVVDIVKNPADDQDDADAGDSDSVESIDENGAVNAVNAYRAMLVHALQNTETKADIEAMINVAADTIAVVDPKFLDCFRATFKEQLDS